MSNHYVTSSTAGDQGGLSGALNDIDFTNPALAAQYAQKLVLVGMNDYKNTMQELLTSLGFAESASLKSMVASGFSSGTSQEVIGFMEAGMAIASTGAGAFGITSSIKNVSDINALNTETAQKLAAPTETLNTLDQESAFSVDELATRSLTPAELSNPEQPEDIELADRTPNSNNIAVTQEEPPVPEEPEEQVSEGPSRQQVKNINREHDTKLEALRAQNTKNQNVVQTLQYGANILKLPSQYAQGNAQVTQMTQQVQGHNYDAQTQTGNSGNQTLQALSQIDVFAANVASSRA